MRQRFWRSVCASHVPAVCGLLISTVVAFAQTPPPPPSGSASTQQPDTSPPAQLPCNTAETARAHAGAANVGTVAGESLQHKNWQPVGGLIEFTIVSFDKVDSDAPVTICFRWKTTPAASLDSFVEARPTRKELSNEGKTLKLTVAIPEPPKVEAEIDRTVFVVPLAEIRTLINRKGKSPIDVWSVIGITNKWYGIILAVLVVILVLLVLHWVAGARVTHPPTLNGNWLLRIISTRGATASLSQLQILLWTLVVAASTVYVAILSGQLIEITAGTLVLLGISGAAALGTQAQGASELAAAQKKLQQASQQLANLNAAGAPAAQIQPAQADLNAAQADVNRLIAPGARQPQWSDLIASDDANGVDITRVQMLLFTLIAASFVAIKVIATYVIPEISQNFLLLMGISNGVYLTSKVVQKP